MDRLFPCRALAHRVTDLFVVVDVVELVIVVGIAQR